MSMTFYSDKPVNIKQLIDAGIRCGIEITKHPLHNGTYIMTWDVDDYEHYATEVLYDESNREAFREQIIPVNGRFVMERDFSIYRGDCLVYDYNTRCDDAGICHRLFNHLEDNELIHEDEFHQRTYGEHELATRADMEQEDVALAVEVEHRVEVNCG